MPFEKPIDVRTAAKVRGKPWHSTSTSSDPCFAAQVDAWLKQVETHMISALTMQLKLAVQQQQSVWPKGDAEYSSESLMSWIERFATQVVILASSVGWVAAIEAALRSTQPDALAAPLAGVTKVLSVLAAHVLKPLEVQLRKKLEQLITELVHQRDVTRRLQTQHVESDSDFDWLYHLRYYWTPGAADEQQLQVKVANASFEYGFEYLGVGERLVQTPLTDRCYLTLTQVCFFALFNRACH